MAKKKKNPLRQLPLDRNKCGEIRIHLAELCRKKCFIKSAFFSCGNAETTIKEL